MSSRTNSTTNAANNAKKFKVMPAMLLKQLRATASLRCYDYLFSEDSMKNVALWKKGYNLFHGNEDLNIIPQVKLLVSGRGNYARIYKIDDDVVTDHNATSICNNMPGDISNSTHRLVIREVFNPNDNAYLFTSGVHFTIDTVASSTKSSNNKCTGRAIIELSKLALKNIKKAVVIADNWLNDGELPSGTSWDDLYAHVIDVHKEKLFIGFMAFVCMTKYSKGRTNELICLQINNDDVKDGEGGKTVYRKKAKTCKDDTRDLNAGCRESPFAKRGLSFEARVQVRNHI